MPGSKHDPASQMACLCWMPLCSDLCLCVPMWQSLLQQATPGGRSGSIPFAESYTLRTNLQCIGGCATVTADGLEDGRPRT